MLGEVQLAKAPESTRHLKLEPASELEKPKVGVESLILAPVAGPEAIVVSGAVASTVKLRLAALGSSLPAGSVALTSKVWAPLLSGPTVLGDVQLAKLAESTRHLKLEPASELAKPKVGVESLVVVPFAGPLPIVVSGGCESGTSTVNVRDSGVASRLSTPSTARTSNVWEPSARPS